MTAYPRAIQLAPAAVSNSLTTAQIGLIIAHEFGHAIGLDGTSGNALCNGQSQTVMAQLNADYTPIATKVQPTDVALANQHMNRRRRRSPNG